MDRDAAVDRLETLLNTVESERMPVPIRELWVLGDLALGLDPVDRLELYVTKDILLRDDAPDRASQLEATYGVKGLGRTVRANWAEEHPDAIRANDNGYAAPERCLAAHLLADEEPIHLEVCNTGFEDNVTQRLKGATARQNYSELLDPRGVCVWQDGRRSPTAFDKLRDGAYVFPTLSDALQQLGLDQTQADTAARELDSYRQQQSGTTIRGDVV